MSVFNVNFSLDGCLNVKAESEEAAKAVVLEHLNQTVFRVRPIISESLVTGNVAAVEQVVPNDQVVHYGQIQTEAIGVVVWQREDLEDALNKAGYRPSEENVRLVLDGRCTRTLEERSIEEGWEILDVIISNVDGLELNDSEEDEENICDQNDCECKLCCPELYSDEE